MMISRCTELRGKANVQWHLSIKVAPDRLLVRKLPTTEWRFLTKAHMTARFSSA